MGIIEINGDIYIVRDSIAPIVEKYIRQWEAGDRKEEDLVKIILSIKAFFTISPIIAKFTIDEEDYRLIDCAWK